MVIVGRWKWWYVWGIRMCQLGSEMCHFFLAQLFFFDFFLVKEKFSIDLQNNLIINQKFKLVKLMTLIGNYSFLLSLEYFLMVKRYTQCVHPVCLHLQYTFRIQTQIRLDLLLRKVLLSCFTFSIINCQNMLVHRTS